MKKNMNAVLMALALAFALSSCAGSGSNAESSAEETAAETTVSAAETTVSVDTAVESTAAFADAETEESAESESTETEDETVSVIEYEINGYGRTYPGLDDEDVRFTADAEFIHITTPGHDALQASLDELNSANRRQADEAFSQQAKEFAAGNVTGFQLQLLPYSNESTLSVSRADSVLFSIATTNSSWYGGAHPYSYQTACNYDSQSGRKLELADLVTDGEAFYDLLHETLSSHEYKEGFFDDWEDTLRIEYYGEDDARLNWRAENDGILIWFNQYDLGPYALGPVSVKFAAADHPGLIRAEYFPEGLSAPEGVSSADEEERLYVYDLCNERGSLEKDDYTVNYSFRLPEIGGIDTDYIREINEEIADLKTARVDRELEMIENGEAPVIRHAGYSAVTWKDITSVILSIDTPSDETIYRCWNLHKDGTKAENEEILALFGLTEEEFTEKAREALSEMTDWNTDGLEEPMRKALEELREKTLSEDNCNAGLPMYITGNHGLGFIGAFYTPAGSGYVETRFAVPGTENRPDGLTELSINPMSADNYTLTGDAYEIRDNGSGKAYTFDEDTVLIEGLPCYDDACDPMTWMERYLSHPAFGDMTEDPYSLSGFAPGDILTILVDDKDRISVLETISFWD